MSKEIYHILQNMHELASAQRDALHQGNHKEAVAIQAKRQGIIEKIQNIDEFIHAASRPIGKNNRGWDDFSQVIRNEIEMILSIDRDMQAFVQNELTTISDLLGAVQRAKNFCNSNGYSKKHRMLNLTA